MLTTLFVYDILEEQGTKKKTTFNHIVVVNAFDKNGAERIVHDKIGRWISETDYINLSIEEMFETRTREWNNMHMHSTITITDYKDTYGIVYENYKKEVLFALTREQDKISFIHINKSFSGEANSGLVIRKLIYLSGFLGVDRFINELKKGKYKCD